MPGGTRVLEDDFNPISSKQERGEADADASLFVPANEKENNTRENNVAKIKVVVCQCFIDISNAQIHEWFHTCSLKHVERSDFPMLRLQWVYIVFYFPILFLVLLIF